MQCTLTTNAEMTWISEENSASRLSFLAPSLTWSHIEKDRKRVKQAQQDSRGDSLDAAHNALKEALEVIKNEEAPKTIEEKEGYFMTHVGIGEQLAAQGS